MADQLAMMMDAVHNIAEYVLEWHPAKDAILRSSLQRYDARWARNPAHSQPGGHFSMIEAFNWGFSGVAGQLPPPAG